jgi:MoxR-like ATPase
MREVMAFAERVIDNVERVIIGKRREVELALIVLLCGGHVLIEDVPGVGKTVLATSIAASLGCHVMPFN